jgi:hypothetical protein
LIHFGQQLRLLDLGLYHLGHFLRRQRLHCHHHHHRRLRLRHQLEFR